MKQKNSFRVLFIVGVLAALFSTAAIPGPGSTLTAALGGESDLVALTVENRSSGYIYIWLDGPSFYYLSVKPEETRAFTVARGEYDQKVRACGDTVENTVDISKQTKMIMPVCGGHAGKSADSSVVDFSEVIKIVKFTLENESDTRLLAILTGPATYVFQLEEGVSKDYTIAKGDYEVQYFACGKVGYKDLYAFHGKVFTLTCP
jgi:hypothetical protein